MSPPDTPTALLHPPANVTAAVNEMVKACGTWAPTPIINKGDNKQTTEALVCEVAAHPNLHVEALMQNYPVSGLVLVVLVLLGATWVGLRALDFVCFIVRIAAESRMQRRLDAMMTANRRQEPGAD